MSVYFVKGKGWRFDFTLEGIRYTEAWFETKRAAKQAEAKKRKELKNPKPDFLDLINLRLDYVKTHNSEEHYRSYLYLARKWVKKWGDLICSDIDQDAIENHIEERRKISAFTANKDLRYLRAAFNFGIKKKLISNDPTEKMGFFPIDKRVKYVPPNEDIDKVIAAADNEDQDYLWTIRETMARVSEINRLQWEDVRLEGRFVILYTRKKKGGHLTPRKVPMTQKLYDVLKRRAKNRDPCKPWVFWHRYWSRKKGL